MVMTWLKLLVALLVGLSSTVTAQTLDRQQLDISGVLETNPASPGDFGGKHLSKHQAVSVEDPTNVKELRKQNSIYLENVAPLDPGPINRHELLQTHSLNSDMPNRVQTSYNIPKISVNADNSSSCPEPTDIEPCVCELTSGSYDLRLICSAVESLEQLGEIFKHDFPNKEFDEFQIFDNDKIQYLTDIFNGVSFKLIQLSFMPNLTEISNYAFFDSLDVLEIIYIHVSALEVNTFPFNSLNEFPKLTSLTISEAIFDLWPEIVSSSMTSVSFYNEQISALPAGMINRGRFINVIITGMCYYVPSHYN